MDKKKHAKIYSLNRAITLLILAGYCCIVGMLFLADMYLISDYQRKSIEKNRDLIFAQVEKASEKIRLMEDDLHTMYLTNDDFLALSGSPSGAKAVALGYDIIQQIEYKSTILTYFDGFFLFYNDAKDVRYYIASEKMGGKFTFEERQSMLNNLRGIIPAEETQKIWTVVLNQDQNLEFACIYKKNHAAICGISSLKTAVSQLEVQAPAGSEISIFSSNAIYWNEESAKKLGLMSLLKDDVYEWDQVKHDKHIYVCKLEQGDVWFCMAVPESIANYIGIPQLLLSILTIGSIVVLILLIRFVKKEVLRPIKELTNMMYQIGQGNWDVRPLKQQERFYEISEINDTFVSMLEELKKQKIEIYEETIEKQKAQMQYLQLQLRPHFFLNCLKTLNAMAIKNQDEVSQNLIMNISLYLRYLLQNEREIVSLKEELEFVKNYIEMQGNMTGRKVTGTYLMDEGMESCGVPMLSIQTFVENSIKYAKLMPGNTELKLTVQVQRLVTEDGNFVNILVDDNGCGYPPEVLENINGETTIGARNVGINNLKRRCQMLYGEKAEFLFLNIPAAHSELIFPEKNIR